MSKILKALGIVGIVGGAVAAALPKAHLERLVGRISGKGVREAGELGLSAGKRLPQGDGLGLGQAVDEVLLLERLKRLPHGERLELSLADDDVALLRRFTEKHLDETAELGLSTGKQLPRGKRLELGQSFDDTLLFERLIGRHLVNETDQALYFLEKAEARIVTELSANSAHMAPDVADRIVKESVAAEIAAVKKPGLEFHVLSGVLKVEGSVGLPGVTLRGGEVNIYKVLAPLAVVVSACPDFKYQLCNQEYMAALGNEKVDSEAKKPPKGPQ